MASVFNKVSPLRASRSAFTLSYQKLFDCDMGQLIPVMCDEAIPGDIWNVRNELVARFKPLVSPVLHEINVYVHYFFVPYRLLWDDFENFVTGGLDGEFSVPPPEWNPVENGKGTLWDYLGFPVGVDPVGAYPLDYPRMAYNFIYNEFYRSQDLMEPVDLDNELILNACWEKDYFTASLPMQQRGPDLALPVTVDTTAEFDGDIPVSYRLGQLYYDPVMYRGNVEQGLLSDKGSVPIQTNVGLVVKKDNANDNIVYEQNAATFDVSDLRTIVQMQKWRERNMRAGVRYVEFLPAHFPVWRRLDQRLDRPEYIGGSKSPVIISEVLQTSETTANSAQGKMAGHGITADRSFINKYRVEEFGLIMGIMHLKPRTMYHQGINRQWLRKTRWDVPFREFANLSEQAVMNAEIYATNDPDKNNDTFGYIPRYDELRTKENMVCNNMRDLYQYWHLGRSFANAPALNEEFVKIDPASTKRIFAVQNEPGIIVNFANVIKCFRPFPIESNPGLMDHF
jgi:hypothetical protein